MMKNFIRLQDSPVIEGYDEPPFGVSCPEISQEAYSLPINIADEIKFIIDGGLLAYRAGDDLKVGLIDNCCKNVSYDIGSFTASDLNRQLYFTVNIPSGLQRSKYYRLVFYKQEVVATEWEEVDRVCQLDENGNRTRNAVITEERTVTGTTRTPIAVSNALKVTHPGDITKIIEYRGDRYDFGYDYISDKEFVQQIRLHLTIEEAKPKISTRTYRQTNGVHRRGNTYIDKTRILHTDYFDEQTHDALANALHHNFLMINGVEYFTSGEYEKEFSEAKVTSDRYYPLSTAQVELTLQGFNQQNNKCTLDPSEYFVFDDTFRPTFE